MSDVVKIEVKRLPTIYIVGKQIRYKDAALNSGDNRLPGFWDACYAENIFAPLEAQTTHIFDHSHAGVFIDWYLGDGDFSYIVGMLMREGVTIPDGYVVRELAETDAARCRIACTSAIKTRTVPFESTAKAIQSIGRSFANMKWCADLFDRPCSPGENGNAGIDCYIPLDRQDDAATKSGQ